MGPGCEKCKSYFRYFVKTEPLRLAWNHPRNAAAIGLITAALTAQHGYRTVRNFIRRHQAGLTILAHTGTKLDHELVQAETRRLSQMVRAKTTAKTKRRGRNGGPRGGGAAASSRGGPVVALPRARGRVTSGTKPSTVHSRSERFARVPGSTAFKVTSYRINPGVTEVFPWLAAIARLHEKYQVISFAVRYVPATGTNIAGNVLMAFDPDSLDVPPTSMVEAQQTSCEAHGPPWQEFTLRVPTTSRKLYTRADGTVTPVSADLKSYDIGQLYICTDGMASTDDAGYVEVDYKVVLCDPQPDPAPTPWNRDTWAFGLAADVDLKALAPVGAAVPLVNFHKIMGSSDVVQYTQHFHIPKGVFRVTTKVVVENLTSANTSTNWSTGTLETLTAEPPVGTEIPVVPGIEATLDRFANFQRPVSYAAYRAHTDVKLMVGPQHLMLYFNHTTNGSGDASIVLQGDANYRYTTVFIERIGYM